MSQVPALMGLFAGFMLLSGTAAATSETAEALRCLRENLPPAMAIRVRAETDNESSPTARQEWLYARRPSGLDGHFEHWLQMLAPSEVRGVTHLFRPLAEGYERYSFLPALGRTRRLEGVAVVSGLEEVAGAAHVLDWLRWPSEAMLTLGPVHQEAGRSLRALRATRHVGEGKAVGFERMEGQFDPATCLLLSLRVSGVDGVPRATLRLDPAGLRQREGHWLPTRMDVEAESGRRSRLQFIETQVRPTFAREVFDPQRFHYATSASLGLSSASAP